MSTFLLNSYILYDIFCFLSLPGSAVLIWCWPFPNCVKLGKLCNLAGLRFSGHINILIHVFLCNYDKISMLDRVRKIYKMFPQIPLPQHLPDDDELQQFSEALGAAKIRVEGCSSFLKAAIK